MTWLFKWGVWVAMRCVLDCGSAITMPSSCLAYYSVVRFVSGETAVAKQFCLKPWFVAWGGLVLQETVDVEAGVLCSTSM